MIDEKKTVHAIHTRISPFLFLFAHMGGVWGRENAGNNTECQQTVAWPLVIPVGKRR